MTRTRRLSLWDSRQACSPQGPVPTSSCYVGFRIYRGATFHACVRCYQLLCCPALHGSLDLHRRSCWGGLQSWAHSFAHWYNQPHGDWGRNNMSSTMVLAFGIFLRRNCRRSRSNPVGLLCNVWAARKSPCSDSHWCARTIAPRFFLGWGLVRGFDNV